MKRNDSLKIYNKLAGAVVWTLCGTLLINSYQTEELTAEHIVAKSWQLYRQALDEMEQIELKIDYYDSREEVKVLKRWIKYDRAGQDKIVIKFIKPARDNGLGLLIWRHIKGNDDQC